MKDAGSFPAPGAIQQMPNEITPYYNRTTISFTLVAVDLGIV